MNTTFVNLPEDEFSYWEIIDKIRKIYNLIPITEDYKENLVSSKELLYLVYDLIGSFCKENLKNRYTIQDMFDGSFCGETGVFSNKSNIQKFILRKWEYLKSKKELDQLFVSETDGKHLFFAVFAHAIYHILFDKMLACKKITCIARIEDGKGTVEELDREFFVGTRALFDFSHSVIKVRLYENEHTPSEDGFFMERIYNPEKDYRHRTGVPSFKNIDPDCFVTRSTRKKFFSKLGAFFKKFSSKLGAFCNLLDYLWKKPSSWIVFLLISAPFLWYFGYLHAAIRLFKHYFLH